MATRQPNATCRSKRHNGFVEDGHARALAAIAGPLLDEIRAAVEAELADELASAGPIGRILIRRGIEREIQRRYRAEVEKHAPPWALY